MVQTEDDASRCNNQSAIDESLTTAVELLSHETRARTLVTLAAHHAESPRDPAVSFSDLRQAVGHDDPGNFNYHLGRLKGTLVEQTDEGYELSYIGGRFVGTLLSERFDPAADPSVADSQTVCPMCGDAGRVTYEQGTLQVDCETGHSVRLNIGANVLEERSVTEALNLGLLRSVVELRQSLEGLCPMCDGRTEGGLKRPSDENTLLYLFSCRRCGATFQTPASMLAVDHPRVVTLCHDHGIEARREPLTVLTEHVSAERLVTEGPPRVEVAITVADDRLSLRFDEDGRVISTSSIQLS